LRIPDSFSLKVRMSVCSVSRCASICALWFSFECCGEREHKRQQLRQITKHNATHPERCTG
jgi:hypothetical protein